jgi:predicted enzyme related to lactoylglutathione lyase
VIYDPDRSGTVLEFCVDDLDAATDKLVSKSCQVIKWRGKDCYMQDPFGMIFNLWEENAEK